MGVLPVVEFCAVERRTRPIQLCWGEKLVIRLWSWDEERLLKDASDGFVIETSLHDGIQPEYYSISVFALTYTQGETIADLVDRLTAHAAEYRRFKWYCLVTESELTDAGFQLILNEPPDDHYDIPLGKDAIDLERVTDLAVLFGDEKIRMRS